MAVPETPDTRLIVDTNEAFHCYSSTKHVEMADILHYDGTLDVTYPANLKKSADFFFRISPERRKFIAALAQDGCGPVSYTHLDVYKRQPYRRQKFLGFGGAFTEASAYCYQNLSASRRAAFLECYFGQSGLRYNLGRTHINSCDFALGNYACVEDPADEALDSFSTERDDQYLIPMILEAQKIRCV